MSDYQEFIAWLKKTYPTHARAYSGDPVIQSAFFSGLAEGRKVCTSDEWLANATQSTRDLANKVKSQQFQGTCNQLQNETVEGMQAREIKSLTDQLRQEQIYANQNWAEVTRLKKTIKECKAQTYEFERKWLMACERFEDQLDVITRREDVIKSLTKDLDLATKTVYSLNGTHAVMINLMRDALRVIETIETEDQDEDAELTRLKDYMTTLIDQWITSLTEATA